MQKEQPLQKALDGVAEVLVPQPRSLTSAFRRRLTEMGFTPEQRRLIESVTTGGVAQAYRSGVPPARILQHIQASGRELALQRVKLERLTRATSEYGILALPLFQRIDSAQQPELMASGHELYCTLMSTLTQSYFDVRKAENRFLRDLLETGAACVTDADFATAVLGASVRHFGAVEGAVFARRSASPVLVCSSQPGRTVALTLHRSLWSQLGRIRQLSPSSLVVLPGEWRQIQEGSVWSLSPTPGLILQLLFDHNRPVLARELWLLESLAETWRLALERLQREDRLRRISLRMLEVEELERRRISRELHDDAGQSLVVIRLQLEMIELSLSDSDQQIRQQLGEIRELTEKTILSVRKLISELSPAVLQQLGLAAAIRQLANRFRQSYDARIKLHIGKLPQVHPRLELVIYRVLQECFANIAQHSGARHINVSLSLTDEELRLKVEDDGVGFNVEEGLGRRNCYGLLGIRERVGLLGGTFWVESSPANGGARAHPQGTKVVINLPLTNENLREVEKK